MILAAIDIGSNAARLLICETSVYVDGTVDFTKLTLLRIPLRLGFDVFDKGTVSDEKKKKLIETIKAYKLLMNIYNVEAFKACATSAMRDATNGKKILEEIYSETGMKIDIITGQEEANIIYETHIAEKLSDNKSYLYIDVGGGSTEITVFIKGKAAAARSFDIGTIRLLSNQVQKEYWKELKDWLRKETKGIKAFSLVGSGGNINRLFKMAELKQGKPLTFDLLHGLTTQMKRHTVDERMRLFDLNPDRADVIVPAGEIFLNIMKFVGATKIYVPKIGLSDGMVREVYKEYKSGKRSEIV